MTGTIVAAKTQARDAVKRSPKLKKNVPAVAGYGGGDLDAAIRKHKVVAAEMERELLAHNQIEQETSSIMAASSTITESQSNWPEIQPADLALFLHQGMQQSEAREYRPQINPTVFIRASAVGQIAIEAFDGQRGVLPVGAGIYCSPVANFDGDLRETSIIQDTSGIIRMFGPHGDMKSVAAIITAISFHVGSGTQ